MADIDWTSLLQSGVQAATGYVQQQMQLKQAKKLAKIAAGAPAAGFPMLGTGNMSFGYSSAPLGAPMGYGYSGGVPMGDVQPASFLSALGLGAGSLPAPMDTGGVVVNRPPRGLVYSLAYNARGGQTLMALRSAGQPILWSGDLAAVRRVARVARKLGRFVHRRPR